MHARSPLRRRHSDLFHDGFRMQRPSGARGSDSEQRPFRASSALRHSYGTAFVLCGQSAGIPMSFVAPSLQGPSTVSVATATSTVRISECAPAPIDSHLGYGGYPGNGGNPGYGGPGNGGNPIVYGGAPGGDRTVDNGGSPGNAGGAPSGATPSPSADAARAIEEADLVKLEGTRLYALSKSGSLAVVEVACPGCLQLLGAIDLPGVPFEMYVRGSSVVAMINPVPASQPETYGGNPGRYPDGGPNPTGPARVIRVDVTDPAHMQTLATVSAPGEIADSRFVGDILYLTTYQNGSCLGCGTAPLTLVTSFDASNAAALTQVDQASFASNAPAQENLAWGMAWKRSIVAVPGNGSTSGATPTSSPARVRASSVPARRKESSTCSTSATPSGHFVQGARVEVAGAVLSRWQMDETKGVLRVVSQLCAGLSGNGMGDPEVATFRVESSQSITPLGKATLKLPRPEGLRTVRFDGDRAYADHVQPDRPALLRSICRTAARAAAHGSAHDARLDVLPRAARRSGDRPRHRPHRSRRGSSTWSLFDSFPDLCNPRMLKRAAFGTTAASGRTSRILDYEVPWRIRDSASRRRSACSPTASSRCRSPGAAPALATR